MERVSRTTLKYEIKFLFHQYGGRTPVFSPFGVRSISCPGFIRGRGTMRGGETAGSVKGPGFGIGLCLRFASLSWKAVNLNPTLGAWKVSSEFSVGQLQFDRFFDGNSVGVSRRTWFCLFEPIFSALF